MAPRPQPLPPLIGRLTLLAEQLSPMLARLPKTQNVTLGRMAWQHLDETLLAVFTALNDSHDHAARVRAAAHFDQLKWYLRLLETRRLVSRGWLTSISPDVIEIGKMLGGFVRVG